MNLIAETQSVRTKNVIQKRSLIPTPTPVPGARWIPLTKGLFALVDEKDYEAANRFAWTADINPRTAYAYCKRGGEIFWLHRILMSAPENMQVDHRDGNGLDCRRDNMRVCSLKNNHRNIRKTIVKTSSKFKGVSWDKTREKWSAKIKFNGKTINLGRFEDEDEAGKAYDESAGRLFGEFALLNFP